MSDHTSVRTFTQFRSLFCSLVFDPELTLGQATSTKWISEVVAQEVGKTCDRVFNPLVTLALFLGQVLSDDHSLPRRRRQTAGLAYCTRFAGVLAGHRRLLQGPSAAARVTPSSVGSGVR